jgi:broad specificity phosphatase PhoE
MRHGQTEANLNGIVNGGGSDTPLLPGGRAKLKSVGDALNDVEFDACYSSPLGRTRRSAQIVLGQNKYWNNDADDIKIIKGLADINMGKAEGRSNSDILREYGANALKTGAINDPDFKSPIGAETTYHFVKRFDKAMNSIVEDKANHNRTVFVVAHSSASYWIRKITGDKKYHMITNAEVVKLQYKNGKWKVM